MRPRATPPHDRDAIRAAESTYRNERFSMLSPELIRKKFGTNGTKQPQKAVCLQVRAECRMIAQNLDRVAKKEGRDFTDEEQAQYSECIALMEYVNEALEHDSQFATFEGPPSGGPSGGYQGPNFNGLIPGGRTPSVPMDSAFSNYLRYGAVSDLNPGADGAVMIPTEMYSSIVRLSVGYRPVETVARNLSTDTGAPLKFVSIDDTESGEYLVAEEDTGAALDPTALGSLTLGAYKASSKPVSVARELLVDSQYDVGAEIVAVLVNRTARLLNKSFTKGTGVAEPTGFLHGCTKLGVGATTINLDDVMDLAYAIPPQFRKPSNVYMMSSATQKFLRKLKTGIPSDQNPLWQASPRAGEPDTLYGHGVVINEDMASVSVAGVVTEDCVAFGDFQQFLVRHAGGAYILRYPVPTKDSSAFIVFERADSRLLVSSAIVSLGVSGS
jgi:HK97 family phage major capsid protein